MRWTTFWSVREGSARIPEGLHCQGCIQEMGYIGQIRGYETTHGRKGTNNGWHPHFHFLQFVMVKGTLRSSWTGKRGSICGGMPTAKRPDSAPSFQHGIDLRDGSFASNYVAKWGLEDEMTKGHIKKGKAGGNAFRPAARCSGRQGRQAGGCAVR